MALQKASLYGFLCAAALVNGSRQARAQDVPLDAPARAAQTGPTVAIMQPSYADTLRGTVSVLLGVQSQKYAAKTVEMFVDGQSATGGAIPLESSASTTFNWDTTLFTDGPHRLTVRVKDTQGFIGQSEVQVYINNGKRHDTTPPALAWLNIHSGDVLKGAVKLGVKASDDFGVKYIFVSINPAATPKRKPALRQFFLNRPPYEVLFDTNSVPDGLYVLDALAWDALENEGHASQRLFGVMNNGLNYTWTTQLDLARAQENTENTPKPPTTVPPAVATSVDGNSGASSLEGGSTGNVSSGDGGGVSHGGGSTSASLIGNGPQGLPHRASPVDSPNVTPVVTPGAEPKISTPVLPVAGSQSPDSSRFARGEFKPRPGGPPEPLPHTHPILPPDDALTVAGSQRNGALSGPSTRLVEAEHHERNVEPSLPPLDVRHLPHIRPEVAQTPASTTVAPVPAELLVTKQPSHLSQKIETDVTRITTPQIGQRHTQHVVDPTSAQAHGPKPVVRIVEIQKPQKPLVASSSEAILQAMGADVSSRVTGPSIPAWSHSNEMRFSSLEGFGLRTMPSAAQPLSGDAVLSSIDPMLQSRISSAGGMVTRPAATPAMRTGQFAMLPPTTPPRTRQRVAITVAPMAGRALPASYVAHGGETMNSLALLFGIDAQALAAVNHKTGHAKLAKGEKIALPRALNVRYKGKPVVGDVGSLMVGSTSATAFRFLFEAQGGTVQWDAARHRVVAQNGAQQVELFIGSRTAIVNEKSEMMDLAAFLLSGRTMVPIRFFEKSLHAQVEWTPSTGRLYVSIANPNTL